MPFIWLYTGITLLISPLQLLGSQHASHLALEKLGIKAVNLTAKTTSDQLFKDIACGVYQLIIASPEYIDEDHRFRKYLWSSNTFQERVNRVIFDEAHCVLDWGDFRPAYRRLCYLPAMLSNAVFLALSATLTPLMVSELKRLLGLYEVDVIRRSNTRSNIAMVIRKMRHSLSSLHDIAFLIPLGLTALSPPPPKFMLFMRTKKDCERAVYYLRSRLPPELQDWVIWVHAEMTSGFNERAMEKLKNGEIFGIVCTDVAGMGIDIPDIDLVVQYQLPQRYCILFQRIGRAARDQRRTATVVILVEPKYFYKPAILATRQSTTRGKKRKAEDEGSTTQAPKKRRTGPRTHGAISQSEDRQGENNTQSQPGTQLAPGWHTANSDLEIEPVMDAFINAKERGTGCRRRPGNQYFANPDVPQEGDKDFCCFRCCPPPPPPERCCDVCHEALVECADAKDNPTAPPRALPQTTIPAKDFRNWNNIDHGLREALAIWRDQAAEVRWGPNHLFGGMGIISDDQMDRIVSLARRGRIPSMSKFQRELKWLYFSQYAVDVLNIVHSSYPPPPDQSCSQPKHATPSSHPSISPQATKRIMTCSGCGQPGHTSMS
ncbi:Helicase conserved C-terminal domain [Ceratobasidium sp. AG-Ba]|nr:Helicase conserved C-terminal domain [Ceratobasidium sp. AG-Ba]